MDIGWWAAMLVGVALPSVFLGSAVLLAISDRSLATAAMAFGSALIVLGALMSRFPMARATGGELASGPMDGSIVASATSGINGLVFLLPALGILVFVIGFCAYSFGRYRSG